VPAPSTQCPLGGRRRAAVVFAAVVGGFLALSSAPAVASTDFKAQPHATPAPTPAPKGHHGHGQTTATNSTAGHSPQHQATPTSSSTSTFRANATTQSTGASSATAQRGGASSEPALPKPAATPTAQPKASAGAGSTNAEVSTWQRAESDHVDRGVVRAFATDLKKAGQSAGFPALLVAVMVGFLLVQHRLDKRDVKLSHADWVSDQGLEFSAPSTIRR